MSASHPLMPTFCKAAAESLRLDALQELQILDTQPEQAFDDLAWLVARLCETPIALVSLVDRDRQWFKATQGLNATETPREVAFCAHAIEADDVMVVEDTRAAPRFCDNPLVTGEPHVRFYAGAPLIGRQGHRFGTLCVVDMQPRQLQPAQREGLVRLARRTSDSLEARRQRMAAEARETTLEQLLEAMPNAVVTCDAKGALKEFNRVAREWHGADTRELPDGNGSQHLGLHDETGTALLAAGDIPLRRALKGERIREAAMVFRAAGQPPRKVLCNADPLVDAGGKTIGAVCVMHDVSRLSSALDAVRVETQRFADAFSAAAQGMALVSLDGGWLEVNDALCEMFGYTREELRALDFQRLTHPEDLQADVALVEELLAGRRKTYQLDKRYFHRTGRTLYARLSVSLVLDARGEPMHFVAQIQDETERHVARQELRDSEARMRTVADNVPALIGHVGADLRYRFVNRPYAEWFGKTVDEIVGRTMGDVLRPEHFAALRPKLQQVLAGETLSFDMDVTDKSGRLRHMQANYVPDRSGEAQANGKVHGLHLMIHDLTAQTRLARMLEERAMTDELTGLPNRAAWNAELERGLARAQRGRLPMAVMFLDLNGFKRVNDSLGHAAGDALLCEFTRRLRGALRGADFAARLSGDEFVVLLDGDTDSDAALAGIAAKVHEAMAPSVQLNEHTVRMSPSIGFAVQPAPACDLPRLMAAADEAMYQSKRSGTPFAVIRC